MSLGSNLKQLREREGLTQRELADKLKVSKSVVGMWESGSRYPNHVTEEAIADFFNISIATLRGDDQNEIDLSISNTELDLIIKYRNASKEEKEMVNRILNYSKLLKDSKK